MAASALVPVAYHLFQGLQGVDLRSYTEGFDLQHFIHNIDLKTVSWIALVVVGIVFLYDLFTKSSGYNAKSLAVAAADTWQENKNQITYGITARGSRSLEPLTEVLDALAEAVKKWEEPGSNVLEERS
ncbi:uncharacterized protein LOC135220192 isoform X1 [Macrobrachium nipponense]|uniref:uncharacterized protein LOC135220192 isoform X1 n=1 Tax=Macrobrachium nipponense TaxID=159736 RepID=UPI0030C8318A